MRKEDYHKGVLDEDECRRGLFKTVAYAGICLSSLRKITELLCEDSWYPA
jgi:hypothetical protein